MSRVSLLHISDLHISKYPALPVMSRRSPGNYYHAVRNHTYAASHGSGKLNALVNLVHDVKDSLDGILITGDIATTGLDFDLSKALAFVEGVPDPDDARTSGGFPTLRGAGCPVHLLPGNHDRYKLRFGGLGYAPGGRKFHKIFHSYWKADVMRSAVLKTDLAVGIIASDFSLRNTRHAEWSNLFVNAYSQGKAYDDVVRNCMAETQAFKTEHEGTKDVFIIWAVHFPPVPEQGKSYMKFLDRQRVLLAANNSGVSLILSGHTHDPFDFKSPRHRFHALGTGSATQHDSPEGNYCQLVSIENSRSGFSLEIVNYGFDGNSGRGRFVRV